MCVLAAVFDFILFFRHDNTYTIGLSQKAAVTFDSPPPPPTSPRPQSLTLSITLSLFPLSLRPVSTALPDVSADFADFGPFLT